MNELSVMRRSQTPSHPRSKPHNISYAVVRYMPGTAPNQVNCEHDSRYDCFGDFKTG